jgi:hypothetical protein
MTAGDLTGIPVLDAYDDGKQYRVWCVYCKRWHYHGRQEGDRAAHCAPDSPYTASGYVLRLAGYVVDLPKRRKARRGAHDAAL